MHSLNASQTRTRSHATAVGRKLLWSLSSLRKACVNECRRNSTEEPCSAEDASWAAVTILNHVDRSDG
jgi:hypothetical protein